MNITLGHDEDLIRFWWPWPSFQGHSCTNMVKFRPVRAYLQTLEGEGASVFSTLRVWFEIYFLYFSSKTYVVGTQKNSLNQTVLLSTQNTCLNWWVRKYLQFCAHKISFSGPMTLVIIESNLITSGSTLFSTLLINSKKMIGILQVNCIMVWEDYHA